MATPAWAAGLGPEYQWMVRNMPDYGAGAPAPVYNTSGGEGEVIGYRMPNGAMLGANLDTKTGTYWTPVSTPDELQAIQQFDLRGNPVGPAMVNSGTMDNRESKPWAPGQGGWSIHGGDFLNASDIGMIGSMAMVPWGIGALTGAAGASAAPFGGFDSAAVAGALTEGAAAGSTAGAAGGMEMLFPGESVIDINGTLSNWGLSESGSGTWASDGAFIPDEPPSIVDAATDAVPTSTETASQRLVDQELFPGEAKIDWTTPPSPPPPVGIVDRVMKAAKDNKEIAAALIMAGGSMVSGLGRGVGDYMAAERKADLELRNKKELTEFYRNFIQGSSQGGAGVNVNVRPAARRPLLNAAGAHVFQPGIIGSRLA